jgi:hypothetical protein
MSVMEERLTLSNTELKRLKALEMIQNEQVTVATHPMAGHRMPGIGAGSVPLGARGVSGLGQDRV